MFENALRKLLLTTSFNKITVQSLVEYSYSSRPTFYNHFKDKYDLVSWIYQRQADMIINKFPEITWIEVIINLFKTMEQDYLFYSKVLVGDDQNSLVNYMVSYDVEVYKTMLRTIGGFQKIDEQLAFDIQFHAFACVHMTRLWIQKKERETPKELAQKLINAMPSKLYESLPNRGIDHLSLLPSS
ncbi:TetR/AcrR family transcriptional regulator C-terminal domain-containing protein [Lachnospiraceae bacterium ZAX-1]